MKTLSLVRPTEQQQIQDVLAQGSMYPDHPASVRVIETHLSFVFLTDQFAYKLRKPVRYGIVDLTTLAARFEDAQREVRWNRRLAEDLYFGVIPLTYSVMEGFRLEGNGPVVEWLVKMRRLPDAHMLVSKIANQTLSEEDLKRLGCHLINFYKSSAPVLSNAQTYTGLLKREIEISDQDLTCAGAEIDLLLTASLKDCLLNYVNVSEEVFSQRVAEGRVVDGHGDLRPEHICIEPYGKPVIFDCLQFNSTLRAADALDELSFLGMECERIGAPEVDRKLIMAYEQITGDSASEELRCFYKAYRAYLWARLAIWRTRELEKSAWTKWTDRAMTNLKLAERFCNRLKQNVVAEHFQS